MLTVGDLATLPELELPVAAGAEGLENAVSWLHVSELADPTRWLEGGEFLRAAANARYGFVGTTTVKSAVHTATQESPVQLPFTANADGSRNSALAMP